MIPKVRGEWPVKQQEVLKDERCVKASLRGGLFNLQEPVNTVSEGSEEKPASSQSTVHHQLKYEPLRRQRSRIDSKRKRGQVRRNMLKVSLLETLS